MKDTNKLNPEIRFSGFTDDWEQRKFEKFAQRQSNTMISNPDNPCIEYEDVISEQGILNKDVCSKDAEKNGIIFTEEDILYGKLRPYLHNWLNPDFKGVAVGDWWVLRPINMDKNFLYWLIQTPQYDNAANQSSGTKMPRADWKLVSNTDFYVPISNEEQAKIAGLFEIINTLITLHQRKLNGLKNVKKAMLEKMFPKNGESVPEIRFSGFTDDWEQRKLSSMTNYKNGKSHEDKQSTSGKLELINLNSISISGGLKHSGKFIDEADNTLQKDDLVMILSDVGHGDLLGRVALIPEDDRFVLNQRVALLRPNTTADPQFLFSYINAHQYYFKAQGAGMSQLNISKGSVENFISFVPIIEEQKKIGAFFKQLDDTIVLHQRKLDKLKTLKKAMLEKMFI